MAVQGNGRGMELEVVGDRNDRIGQFDVSRGRLAKNLREGYKNQRRNESGIDLCTAKR